MILSIDILDGQGHLFPSPFHFWKENDSHHNKSKSWNYSAFYFRKPWRSDRLLIECFRFSNKPFSSVLPKHILQNLNIRKMKCYSMPHLYFPDVIRLGLKVYSWKRFFKACFSVCRETFYPNSYSSYSAFHFAVIVSLHCIVATFECGKWKECIIGLGTHYLESFIFRIEKCMKPGLQKLP